MTKIFRILLALVVLAGAGAGRAGAHSQKHEESHEMKSQHHAMREIGMQWKALKSALRRSDRKGADAAAEKILKASSGMQDFTPHKKPDDRTLFIAYYKEFTESMTKLRETLPEADLSKPEMLLKPVQDKCFQCHKTFK